MYSNDHPAAPESFPVASILVSADRASVDEYTCHVALNFTFTRSCSTSSFQGITECFVKVEVWYPRVLLVTMGSG